MIATITSNINSTITSNLHIFGAFNNYEQSLTYNVKIPTVFLVPTCYNNNIHSQSHTHKRFKIDNE